MRKSLQIAAAVLFACLAFSAPAHADYRFCNKTSYVLDGAIAVEAGAAATSSGWLRVQPGECGVMLEGDIVEQKYYVYARTIDAHLGSVKYFSGNERFCIVEDEFAVEGREQCAMRGYDSADFLQVATKPGKEWTTTFSEASDYTGEQARIAGAQRLLKDIGFPLTRIDGIAARNTLRAVEAFQRSVNAPVTGRIDEALIGRLVERALAEHEKVGLSFCNKTEELVWAAVGYLDSGDDMSSGWIRIEPGTCRKSIKGKLSGDTYFAYAEAIDETGAVARRNGEPMIWGGTENFCTKATRFEIRGRDRCASRGFDQRGFMRIDTGGAARLSVDLD
ncbi:protein of unknown function DUF1036 [Parvibaculum lavamentivorans DS-1]|uniref:Peptidoglycan binding-like domain-containing protein n=1 Tax=Parvibaculum lavamentivorans (strain DS-1 / DSM 13023 / NCIMB 13966) TaxID=402881 RepID=A7HPT6_PARL1|nr:DUF1036 domain-containing protein [Parvibaculum lavamentivorans]ABS61919.1 protein of unknown function DUF1036 [Parvibaculum lavamentivorans DS-1]